MRLSRNDLKEFGVRLLVPAGGVIAALLISAVFLVLLKANPLAAYRAMLRGGRR